jgi:hypothetical protein
MATTAETDRRDGASPDKTPGQLGAGRGQVSVPGAPAPGVSSAPPETPRRRRDKELATIERALQVLDGDTTATAATSQCLSALAGIGSADTRAAIVALLGLDPAGMRLAKVVLEDRWTREAG